MKLTAYTVRGVCALMIGFFFSCAGHQKQSHQPVPAENLPQIGSRQASIVETRSCPPILVSMISKAENEIALGKPEAAFNTLERALGIDNQNPFVWHLLARARLMQNDLIQAEFLARKSNTMAARDSLLRMKNWAIIADVLEKQGRIQEAGQAREKARE